ncbi:MAG: signal recognition particle-docking protein FtsY [Eubacteriales bacterium]
MSSEKKSLFGRLKEGLSKTRNQIVTGMDTIFNRATDIDDDFYEELEEVLIMGDVGVHTTEIILEELKRQVKEQRIKVPSECREVLMNTLEEQMQVGQETSYVYEQRKSVILVIGVNGVGKTTSVGKLASDLKAKGNKVLLAAADTFRAAASEQLVEWSNRAGVDVITGMEGSDPSSIVYDALQAAKARNVDVLICDTAGRLHNKKNLMEELRKMDRIIAKEMPDAHRENLVVLDASTGQNALNQAKEFGEVSNLSGIILTKMDGTAKGGIAIAIQSNLQVPVKYIGVGEKIDDLQKFDARQFIRALFDRDDTGEEEEEENVC